MAKNMMSAVMEQRPSAMQRATQGDADSFAMLLDPMLNPAYRLAAVMLSDRMAAEDAVQEAAVKAWRNLRQFRGEETSLRPWFLSIVANECRMTRRKRWWSVVKQAEVESDRRTDEPSQEASTDLRLAVSRLSLKDRLPLVLYFYLDLPVDEVARTLRVSPAAAKARIYRAARRLRSDLTLEEVF
jgi:RNA polymerase sigma-70 factor (ECF subfamily)